MENGDVVIDINELQVKKREDEHLTEKRRRKEQRLVNFKVKLFKVKSCCTSEKLSVETIELFGNSIYEQHESYSKLHSTTHKKMIYYSPVIITEPIYVFLYQAMLDDLVNHHNLKYCQRIKVKIGQPFKVKNFDILNRFMLVASQDHEKDIEYINDLNLTIETGGKFRKYDDGRILEKTIRSQQNCWTNFAEKELNINSTWLSFFIGGSTESYKDDLYIDILIEGIILHADEKDIDDLSEHGFRESIKYIDVE